MAPGPPGASTHNRFEKGKMFAPPLRTLILGLVDKNAALQTEQKSCRLRTFKCEGEGVYQNVNDQIPGHEERAQNAPFLRFGEK